MKMEEHVVLVNEQDGALGTMGKLEAHRKGALHRALSIFVLNDRGEVLMHQRAHGKYHSGGLWTNTCCSHPRAGEDVKAASSRRLFEEMGIRCELEHAFTFLYRAEVGNGLVEHELDHVFIGKHEGPAHPDPLEVNNVAWISVPQLDAALRERPQEFTAWVKLCWPRVKEHLQRRERTWKDHG
jgi:isopentenyl-diphosphate delta-isomerase